MLAKLVLTAWVQQVLLNELFLRVYDSLAIIQAQEGVIRLYHHINNIYMAAGVITALYRCILIKYNDNNTVDGYTIVLSAKQRTPLTE